MPDIELLGIMSIKCNTIDMPQRGRDIIEEQTEAKCNTNKN